MTGGTNDLLIVNGDLTLAPDIALNLVFPNGVPLPGTFTLCQCSGTLSGDPSYLNASLGNYSVVFALNTAASPKTVTMTISGLPQSLRWTGQNGSDWDTVSFNWTNTVSLTNTMFSPGDSVRFDDATFQTSVNVAGFMVPGQTTVDTSSFYTFSSTVGGSIAGPGGVVKAGSGTLVFDLTNTYVGPTIIQNGVVQIGNWDDQGSFGFGAVTNYGGIVLNRIDAACVLPNTISGPGGLTNNGGGTVTLSGTSDYSGPTAINSGTIKLGSSTALGATNGITLVAEGAVLDLNGQTNVWEPLWIGGAGTGGGALINSATADATLYGPIALTSDATVGGSRNLILNGVISGPFALTKAGAGITTLAAANVFAGGTVVNAGILSITNNQALGASGVTVNPGAAVLQLNGGVVVSGVSLTNNNASTGANGLQGGVGTNTWAGPVTLGADLARFGAAANSVLNLAGVIGDAGSGFGFRTRGADGGQGVVQLSAANTYLGNTSIDVGIMRLGNAAALPAGTVVGVNNLSGAVLDLAGFSPQIAGLKGIGSVTNSAITISVLTLTTKSSIDYLNTDGVLYGNGGPGSNNFFGVISGNVALTKAGDPDTVLFITNGNTYVGDTTVAFGTLALSSSGSIAGSSNIVVAAGATLDASAKPAGFVLGAAQTLSGNGTVLGNVTANGTVAPGTSIGTLNLSGNLLLQNGSTTAIEVRADGSRDQVICGGTITYGGTLQVANLGGTLTTNNTFKLFAATGYSGAFASVTPAPGAGLAWSTNTLPLDGTLRIISGVALNPTNITPVVAGGSLELSWPADHLGWWLQAQTNSIGAGLSSNWYKVPNSTTVNQMSFPIDKANGSVFYRLVSP